MIDRIPEMAYNFGVDSDKLKRLIKLPKNHSFFLFGPRGSGKSHLLKEEFTDNAYMIDLLDLDLFDKFSRNPMLLRDLVNGLPSKTTYVVIDEVQKIPKLLDVVHSLIESTKKVFILTGSSARKLKYGGANLLAGRAFVSNLYPFSAFELAANFDLQHALEWGLMPKVQYLTEDASKAQYLLSYTKTYLREEIWQEQFIKQLEPFRYFLEVAAQMNGKIINCLKISRDVGVDDKTISSYYSLLEDTLIGFSLNAYRSSFRKRLSTKPKFYFFDMGVSRCLAGTLSVKLQESTSAYGDSFEHFIILEAIKLASYCKFDYRFSYIHTKDDAEIDLVVERPGQLPLLIEIKSSKEVREDMLTGFAQLVKDFGDCEAVCLCREKQGKRIENIKVLPWQEGLQKYFID